MFRTKIIGAGRDLKINMYTRSLAQVRHSKISNDPVTIYEVCKAKEAHTTEWMYALQDADANDPYAKFNMAMETYFTGGSSRACLHYLKTEAAGIPPAQAIIAYITTQDHVGHTPLTMIDVSEKE
eukprot:TRINITY_DN43577_c0_g1_i1.p1 TRINITY_DN43577_c0_g1~~TRINITY_DN43577_c0_g1_i1.p1  ORF type:complete len:136 (+),score=35.13 TRINITY_DN43577_c0_g1_i1:35-409(+)